MRFMNDYDLETARQAYQEHRNRLQVITAVDALRRWTDAHSDGWAYWPRPVKAASRAMTLIEGDGTMAARARPDATSIEVIDALRPIRRFLTTQGTSLEAILKEYP